MSHDGRDPEAVRLGATIKALRRAHGLKQQDLARIIGISQPYMANIESGTKKATMAICRDVAEAFQVPLAAITVRGFEDTSELAEAGQS